MTDKIGTGAIGTGNIEDHGYVTFLEIFRSQFLLNIKGGEERLFTTDADPDDLWWAYLGAFPEGDVRQHHTCHSCRHFIQRYGGLVTIDAFGRTTSALFSMQDSVFHPLAKIVRHARVTGVFYSGDILLGTPTTGVWRHLSIVLPIPSMSYRSAILSPEQAMAERKEDFKNVCRALDEFSLPTLEQAIAILSADELYRGEKVLGQAEFLRDLHVSRKGAINKAHVTWRSIATAPAGFCHPRSSMIGTLLTDIAAGLPLSVVARNFREKMNPTIYQRPSAAPAAQTIAQAESIVAKLGVAPALERRFAQLHEINAVWRPLRPNYGAPAPRPGVFVHLNPKEPSAAKIRLPPKIMTWEKFQRTVLPEAWEIEFFTRPEQDNYCALLTAVHPDAKAILQWDVPPHRNPFSWYIWQGGSSPWQFSLRPSLWASVSAVTLKPSMWHGIAPHQGEAVIFVLRDARETRQAGNGLFPEILKSEFHGIRSVIEAYAKQAPLTGMREGNACGILLQRGMSWPYRFRVTTQSTIQEIHLDRWD